MPITLALYHLSIIFLQDDTSSDFSDLGKKLLGGFVLAVVVAVAYAFIKVRLRDEKPPAEFLSINSSRRTDEPTKVVDLDVDLNEGDSLPNGRATARARE